MDSRLRGNDDQDHRFAKAAMVSERGLRRPPGERLTWRVASETTIGIPPNPSPAGWPLWPLALLCALLPVVAAHLGWWVSTAQGLIPACNPYFDGCVSISRASRHGLGNLLFRMLMLPAATLQALCWCAAAAWVRGEGERVRWPAWLGAVAAVALVLYASFLGSEGRTYELLRRYGIYFYFGCSYLALLAVLRRVERTSRAYAPLMVVAWGCLAFGLASVVVRYAISGEALRDRLENVLEWHTALWLTASFAVLAWAWRRERLCMRLD